MSDRGLLGRLAGDVSVYAAAAAVGKALALVTVPFLTRALSPEGYGVADLATSTAALLTLLVLFSGDIPAARTHGLAENRAERRRVLSSYVWATAAVSIGVSVALLPLSGAIAAGFWAAGDLGGLAALALLLVPISATQAALAQTARIQSRPSVFAALSLVDLLAQLGLAVLFVALGAGPAGVILGFVVGSVIGLAAAAWACRPVLLAPPDWSLARSLVARGAPFLPYASFFILADWTLRTVVANNIGAQSVAELGVAIRVASLLSLVGGAFEAAWGPIGLARVAGAATSELFGRVLLAFAVPSIATALIVGAVGTEVVAMLAGSGYEGAALVLPGLALAYAIAGTEYVLVVAAGVSNMGVRVTLASGTGALLQVALALLLIPQLGLIAVGLVALLGRVSSFLILLRSVRGVISISVARFGGIGILALAVYTLTLVAGTTAGSSPLRWAVAIVVAVVAAVFTSRVFAQRRQLPV